MSKSAFLKWKRGEFLTRSQAVAANCFNCNGESVEMAHDCLGKDDCPLYVWSPWGKRLGLRPVSTSNRSLNFLKGRKKEKGIPTKG